MKENAKLQASIPPESMGTIHLGGSEQYLATVWLKDKITGFSYQKEIEFIAKGKNAHKVIHKYLLRNYVTKAREIVGIQYC